MYLVETPKASAPARKLAGRSLVHRRLSAVQKAALAAQLVEGEATIELTARQAAQLLGVSVTYIHAARQFTPVKRQAVAEGKDTTPLLPTKPATLNALLPPPVTNTQLADIIRTAGLDRILAVAIEVEHAAAAA